jgi:hypothetical protein
MTNRKESAADIVVSVGDEEVVVETLSVNKNVDVETIYGSGQTLPDGYSINEVSYDGDMTCKGDRQDLESKFFDGNGIPKVLDSITITHLDGGTTTILEVIVTSDGYEMNAGETVETSFEFIAMKKGYGGNVDADPNDA